MYSQNNNRSRFSTSKHSGNQPFRRGGFSQARRPKYIDPSNFVKRAEGIHDNENHLSDVLYSDMALEEKVLRNIAAHGYEKATQIQAKAIPPILENNDVIGIANTGTGKTAAFLIPLVNKIHIDRNQRVLILAPTRELAFQIKDELDFFKRGMELDAVLLIGGDNIKRQEIKLNHSPHFIIGTPGRVKDLINRRKLNINLFQNFVLDEVDRMVDIGFINDIKFFIALLPKVRQSLFFSATITPAVRGILQSFVVNPVSVTIDPGEKVNSIDQTVIKVRGGNKKIDMLHDLLAKEELEKVLIFGRTKWGIEKLTNILIERGFRAASIHGNKSQGQRKRALDQFRSNDIKILLATDVASRGLDIDNVTHVINYDPPESLDDYQHRIGRTGRAGKKGVAYTFVEG